MMRRTNPQAAAADPASPASPPGKSTALRTRAAAAKATGAAKVPRWGLEPNTQNLKVPIIRLSISQLVSTTVADSLALLGSYSCSLTRTPQ